MHPTFLAACESVELQQLTDRLLPTNNLCHGRLRSVQRLLAPRFPAGPIHVPHRRHHVRRVHSHRSIISRRHCCLQLIDVDQPILIKNRWPFVNRRARYTLVAFCKRRPLLSYAIDTVTSSRRSSTATRLPARGVDLPPRTNQPSGCTDRCGAVPSKIPLNMVRYPRFSDRCRAFTVAICVPSN